jgi:hypothetical protein
MEGNMAKRFTDTEKWKHPSFRQLPLKAKLAWLYLVDECNHAGMWLQDYELMSFQLGFTVKAQDLAEWFDEKLFIAGDNRLFIPDFVRFQQKVRKNDDLEPSNKAHLPILREFSEYEVSLDHPGMPLPRSLQGPSKVPLGEPVGFPGVDIGIGTGVGNTGDARGGVQKQSTFDFDALYAKYPRKEGKPAGILQCRKQIKTQAQYDALSLAIDRYAAHCARTDQIVKHFSSFVGSERSGHPWMEWCDSATGTVALPGKAAPDDDWKKEYREMEASNAHL